MEREQTTIRLSAELKERIQRKADERGYPVKDLIMFILYLHFFGAILPE